MPCIAAAVRRLQVQRCRRNLAVRLSLAASATLTFALIYRFGAPSPPLLAVPFGISAYDGGRVASASERTANGSASHRSAIASPVLRARGSDKAIRGRDSPSLASARVSALPASAAAAPSATAAAAAAAAAAVAQRWFPDFARSAGARCERILNGSRYDTSKAAQFVRRNKRNFVCTDGDRTLAKVSCDELAAAGYTSAPSTAEGAAFPLAFGLRMHTCAVQAELLLRSVYEPQNVYCVHVDAKAGADVIAAMRHVASCLPNVYVAPPDEDFVYASASQLRADLACMRLLLAVPAAAAAPPWRYFLNIAGQELPLRTNLELVRLLRRYNGSNDIKSTLQPLYRYRYRYRFWCADLYTNRTRLCDLPRLVKKPPPGRVTVYKGLAYGFFSRAFAEYAVAPRGPAAELYEWFKDTFAPEEHFFATLARLRNAPGGYDDGGGSRKPDAASGSNAQRSWSSMGSPPPQHQQPQDKPPTSRAVAWLGGRKRCSGRYVRQVCVYGVGDAPWLVEQQQAIANKFRYDVDPVALQCMAESVINRTQADRVAERARASSSPRAAAASAPRAGADAAAA